MILINGRKMAPKTISDETRSAILKAAWDLIAACGRTDVGQAEIAAAAGVSRQTLFYAFGNRAGLLQAMVSWRDDTSAALARLIEIAANRDPSPETLLAVIDAWLDYLPDVYPVASLLDAAALTDPEAKAAIESRMVGRLLGGLTARLQGMEKAGTLSQGRDPVQTAEAIWELLHFGAWRLLVVDRAWSPAAFRTNRRELIRTLIGPAPAPAEA